MKLSEEGLLDNMDVERLFVLSIDWPVGLKVDPIEWDNKANIILI